MGCVSSKEGKDYEKSEQIEEFDLKNDALSGEKKRLDKKAEKLNKTEDKYALSGEDSTQTVVRYGQGPQKSTGSQKKNENAASQNGNKNAASQNGNENAASQNGNENAATQNGNENTASQNGNENTASQNGNENAASQSGNAHPANKRLIRALWDYEAREKGDLTCKNGDVMELLDDT
jgi:hypothetical protein